MPGHGPRLLRCGGGFELLELGDRAPQVFDQGPCVAGGKEREQGAQ